MRAFHDWAFNQKIFHDHPIDVGSYAQWIITNQEL